MRRIDPSNPMPVFQQIAELIRSRIGAGVFQPGELIPSVRVTAEELLVNPNTVQRAYEQLERDGLIQARKGMGMAVMEGAKSIALDGAGDRISDMLSDVVKVAEASGISRAAVDRAYRNAWQKFSQDRSSR